MILSRRIALDDAWLDEVDNSIVIRSINVGTPKENVQAVNRMGGAGQRITTTHWETLETSVTFAIDLPKTDLIGRRRVFDAAVKWANKTGWLKVNYMPGKWMYVDKTVFQGSGDLWNWTEEFTFTFRAYNVPFWQSDFISKDAHGTSVEDVKIEVPGNVESVMDASIMNSSGAKISYLTIYTKKSNKTIATIKLDGIELAANWMLSISHGTNGIMEITKTNGRETVSLMSLLKASSSDDLYIRPGQMTISYTAERLVHAVFSFRGRYL
jgi:hypothetical protein